MNKILFLLPLLSLVILCGCAGTAHKGENVSTHYSVRFADIALVSSRFHEDWSVLAGVWESSDKGFEKKNTGQGVIMLRRRVDFQNGFSITYEGASDSPGDLSLLLGVSNRTKPVERSVFIGFGAEGNTKTKIEIPGRKTISTEEHLITPGKRHTINVTVKNGLCRLRKDSKEVLQVPCSHTEIRGDRVAIYSWRPSTFYTFSIEVPGGLKQDRSYEPFNKDTVMDYDLVVLCPDNLEEVKERISQKDPSLMQAYRSLINNAEEHLTAGPFSVMDKSGTPPSGDRHDYMSLGPYWWPNPDTEDGLPYIRKDGQGNPETQDDSFDRQRFSNMHRAAWNLSLAYFFTEKEKYAEHAATLVRTWFLDPETKMNPNMKYAQAIPGRTKGRGIGIIDTSRLPYLLDAVTLLLPSNSWTQKDHQGLKTWVGDYLQWLQTSKNGREEAQQHNNHGTWYDAQCAAYALFVEDPKEAHRILQMSKDRIINHIEPDGSQPHELARTKTFSYSCFNLESLMLIADLAEKVGIDYRDLEIDNGRGSIKRAVDFLLQKAPPENMQAWPYKQISPIKKQAGHYKSLLLRAGHAYNSTEYFKQASRINGEKANKSLWNLLYPPLENY